MFGYRRGGAPLNVLILLSAMSFLLYVDRVALLVCGLIWVLTTIGTGLVGSFAALLAGSAPAVAHAVPAE